MTSNRTGTKYLILYCMTVFVFYLSVNTPSYNIHLWEKSDLYKLPFNLLSYPIPHVYYIIQSTHEGPHYLQLNRPSMVVSILNYACQSCLCPLRGLVDLPYLLQYGQGHSSPVTLITKTVTIMI